MFVHLLRSTPNKPITDAAKRLRALSKGDLGSPSPVTYRNDETLVLLTGLSDTIKSITEYISDIKDVLSGVADGNQGNSAAASKNAEYSRELSDRFENRIK